MYNVRFFLDILLAAAALTPYSTAEPADHKAESHHRIAPRAVARPSRLARTVMAPSRLYTVTATGYEAVPGQTDDDPFVTADNSRIKPHYGSRTRWMALSRDLLQPWGGKFRYGDRVRVRGLSPKLDGIYTVHDTMNRRHRHCMDILVHPSEKLDIFCKGVKIQRLAY